MVLDMIYPNPGEAEPKSQFLDPELLAKWGFNGNVPLEFVQYAVTYDDFDPEVLPAGSPDLAGLLLLAEKLGLILVMELLNSKAKHPDYQCDHTTWSVEICSI